MSRSAAPRPHPAPPGPLHGVVLCGGSGARLWPVSRAQRPKPFLDPDGQGTLLARALRRAHRHTGRPVWVVCGEAHVDAVAAEARVAGVPLARILAEPVGRNTGPALAVAARHLPPEAVAWVLPADQLLDDDALGPAVGAAVALAAEGRLVVFGVTPTHAATGYGWIRRGAPRGAGHDVDAFVEKPPQPVADALLARGDAWNAGLFVFRARDLLAALEAHAPDLARAAAAVRARPEGPVVVRLDRDDLAACPATPIDRAVFERTDRASVVAWTGAWSDVGSWDAWPAGPPPADHRDVDGGGVRVIGADRLVVTAGLRDVTVVDTPDALLVCGPGQAAAVRSVVDALRQADRPEVQAALEGREAGARWRLLGRADGLRTVRWDLEPDAVVALPSGAWQRVAGALSRDGVPVDAAFTHDGAAPVRAGPDGARLVGLIPETAGA